ncbi:hypothetical protein PRIC1_015138 [Phytophthora ramorum]
MSYGAVVTFGRYDAQAWSRALVHFPTSIELSPFDLNKLQTSFITLVNEDYPILIGELHIDQDTGVVSVKQTPESSQRGAQGIRFETNATSLTTAEEAWRRFRGS